MSWQLDDDVTPRRLGEALAYVARLHRGQTRKGTAIPYVSHLLAVAALVIEDGGDEEEALAALLHDAAEDHGGSQRLDDIRARFGARVAEVVGECSDTLATVKEPWLLRKRRYLDHLPLASSSAVRVSLADKVHNLRSIVADYRRVGERLWERFDLDADPLWYHRAVLEIVRGRSTSPLVAEMQRLVDELAELVAVAPHPLPDSYWVMPGRLLAGEYPGAVREAEARWKLRRLSWNGITTFLDLTEPGEYGLLPYAHLLGPTSTHRRLSIPDMGVPREPEMTAILDVIDHALAAGRGVYVHCFGGIGRTGTVVGCWLARHGTAPAQALERIAELREGTEDELMPSPQTAEQRRMVLRWHERDRD